MTEAAQPLSRRERRAMEEAARAAEGEVTQALPVAGEPETVSILSRRERRRLERLANPLETWTEEEELIATGQMPAMTPEVIAEQERLAAERAEQERAAAAFAEVAPQPEPVAEPEPKPVAEVAPEPEPQPEPVAEVAPEAEPEPEPAAEPAQPVSQIPADLRHLFPPGSLQARALETQRTNDVFTTNPSAADEIRQLTHEAMEDITRASTGAHPVVEEAPSEVPALPEGVDVEALWNAPTVDEPVREPKLPPASEPASAEAPHDAPVDLAEVPFVQDLPVPSEPKKGDAPGLSPVWSALVPATPSERGEGRGAAAVPVADESPAPSLWDSHPLINPGASPVRELPAEPVQQELPRPDLSALLNTQANPTVEQQAQLRSTEPLTSTGAIPQRVVEPQVGGGTRHFRWAHLAVIGSIAFLLGVVAWNIARSGS
ncbi:MAG: hypothetical protein NVV57_09965 [Demequina sp.]|nr:hypothetical protein [Demequina sp.]